MENEKDTSPLFDLIKSGRDEKKAEPDDAPDFGAQPVEAEEEPAIAATDDVAELGDNAQTRMQAMLGSRNKGLSLRYDTAMLILLALVGLIVIAYLWGHYAGRRLGLAEGRGEIAEMKKAAAEENVGDGGAEQNEMPIPADDGAIERPFYMLQIMTYGESHKDKAEALQRKLATDCYVEIMESDAPNTRYRIVVGRFKDKNSEQAGKFKAYFEKKYGECLFIKRTP